MAFDDKIKFDYAQVGAVRLHYATCGTGEQLVLLLHGFPESWYSWRHQIAALADDYTIVAPDMRGYNLSDKPENVADYKLDQLVDDAINLVHYFGRERAAIIGHDWGAVVAWAAAQKYPEIVRKVGALQVPPVKVWRENLTVKQALASWYMLFFQLPRVPEWLLSRQDFAALDRALKNTTYEPGVFTEADIAEYKRAWREPDALTAMINYYRANFFDLFVRQPDHYLNRPVTVPSLFIYGEHDQAVLPETVRGIGEMIEAPFETFHIPNSAHWVQQETAETVTLLLKEFLAEKEGK